MPGAVGKSVTVVMESEPAVCPGVSDAEDELVMRADDFMVVYADIPVLVALQMQPIGDTPGIAINTFVALC
ncbi:Uncharacterised protein [Serratia entomophila]|nr:Uncharacterised protein [Serratia entomophila]CAI1783002.1 Uncharacterised protein [Serratia entomophila]CAI1947710.1 Uncharacterised protein [Serratia entomophila]